MKTTTKLYLASFALLFIGTLLLVPFPLGPNDVTSAEAIEQKAVIGIPIPVLSSIGEYLLYMALLIIGVTTAVVITAHFSHIGVRLVVPLVIMFSLLLVCVGIHRKLHIFIGTVEWINSDGVEVSVRPGVDLKVYEHSRNKLTEYREKERIVVYSKDPTLLVYSVTSIIPKYHKKL